MAASSPGIEAFAVRDESREVQIVVQVAPGQIETAVSRNYLVTVECWAATKGAAFDLCADALYALESSPRRGPFVKSEGSSGPNEQRDDDGTYYFDATTTITAQRVA
ncbi:hypothetical protein [Homoserinibacter sp. GY 40078]|uniref:hypothetical protein n=1 Tax=Homoserinibacter sp. GY 40078 TaxID=2603275 RepID=UPI0011CA1CDF|nr:hypothetical protein [Homoserinibacter sp. GY 40078]TXK17405.1 hypothetical protein FVQ89_11260 [Homoserinibacter sp. GY 40078]